MFSYEYELAGAAISAYLLKYMYLTACIHVHQRTLARMEVHGTAWMQVHGTDHGLETQLRILANLLRHFVVVRVQVSAILRVACQPLLPNGRSFAESQSFTLGLMLAHIYTA